MAPMMTHVLNCLMRYIKASALVLHSYKLTSGGQSTESSIKTGSESPERDPSLLLPREVCNASYLSLRPLCSSSP